MEWSALWKAVCIVWQQGPVHQAVECLEQTPGAGVSEEAQDAFSAAMTSTEQRLHTRLPSQYSYRLYTGLSKAAERQGHDLTEALMARLGDVLCGNTTDLPISGSSPMTTPRCYFYGPYEHSTPTMHPHCQWLMAQLRSPCTSEPQHPVGSSHTADHRSGSNASSATGTCECDGGGTCALPAAPAPHQPSAASPPPAQPPPTGNILVLGSSNMLEGSTGCHVWPAGLWLAQWLLNHPEVTQGRRCLELGAGAGLVGVVCAKLGASQVWITDGSPGALENCRDVVRLNHLSARPAAAAGHTVRRLMHPSAPAHDPGDAGQAASDQGSCAGGAEADVRVQLLEWGSEVVDAEVVVAADVVYDRGALRQLAQQLHVQLRGPSEHAYIATAVRNPETLQCFLEECGSRGLQAREAAAVEHAQAMHVRFHHCCELEQGHKLVLHRVTAA